MTDSTGLPSGWLPTAYELEKAPEFAVLVALDSTLEAAACAVAVAHPELEDDPECPYWVARRDRVAAERLLAHIDRLRGAIATYRKAILATLEGSHQGNEQSRPNGVDDDEYPF